MHTLIKTVAGLALATHFCAAADVPPKSPTEINISISERSATIGGIELRTAPDGYGSLAAAKKAMGRQTETYPAGLGIRVYAWRHLGIHLQQGFRGEEKGKIFKLQAWLVDTYDTKEKKESGKFSGLVRVDGLEITAAARLDALRPQLEERGFTITEHRDIIAAEKRSVTIFTAGKSNFIERVEVWF